MAALSFAGYSWIEWLRRNKDSVKAIVTAAVALVTYYLANVDPEALRIFYTAVVAIFAKMAVDAIDYWLTARPD